MSTVADVLDRAADVIAERGLCKGSFEGPDGSVCAGGALRVALTGGPTNPLGDDQFGTYMYAVHRMTDVVDDVVVNWNDAPQRTADDVIAALQEAARRERGAA
jgi:hypothetical protein